MIVFAAHVPHSPLLLETVSKQQTVRLKETHAALSYLKKELKEARVDTIVIFSGHGAVHTDAFSIHLHDPFRTDLTEFGDLVTHEEFRPDLPLLDTLQRGLRKAQQPITLDTHETLDYGASVPLLSLTEKFTPIRVIPIAYTDLSLKAHFDFGKAVKDVCAATNKRIAIISSGDLSHCLSVSSPNGYHEAGPQFDEAVIQAIEHTSASSLLQIDLDIIQQAAECGLRPLVMLFGALDGMTTEPNILCYESPFGVGYLTARFRLNQV